MGFSNRCYNQLARIENRPDECKPILSSEPTKGTCHYAPGDFTPNYCSIYIKYGGYEEDYGACIAEASDYNVKLCTQLNDMKQQELCLVTVYLKKENLTDPEVCPLLEEKNRQDDCKLIIIKNSCDANQSDCKVRRCLDLGFSDISSLDLCKQRTAKTTCKNDTKQCSVDLCEELNLSNQKELERCEEMVFRSIDKN